MTRPAVVVLASLILVTVASAEPLPTWGYEVRTTVAPARVAAAASGLAAGETVVLEQFMGRPSFSPPPTMPVPATHPSDRYTWGYTNELLVTFFDEASGGRTYDYATWTVSGVWERVNTADGILWNFLGEEETQSVRWGQNFGGAQRGNRYDLSLGEDGTLTLSMTPDQLNPNFVPEPATVMMAGVGLAGVIAARFRRTRRPAAG
jgi:hypothetical protein